MTAVIQTEGLGKRYRRGVVEPRGMLRDSLTRFRGRRWLRCAGRRKRRSGLCGMCLWR
jgi:hypothetical protein